MLDSIQVIIPALDEEETIARVVKQLRHLGLTQVRVVDNGSTDQTAKRAAAAGAEVLPEPQRGYGQACWTGYQNLDPAVTWILFCDADGSDDLTEIARLIAAAEAGADFVLGNRRVAAKTAGAMTPVQQFGNGLATTLIRWGWGQSYGDLGPLRLIRRDLLERIDMQDRGFGWTLEMQVRAVEAGADIVELPVGYRRRGGGRSKISGTIRGSVAAGTIILTTLGDLWAQSWNRRRLGQWLGGVMVVLGAVLMMPYGDFAVAGTVPWFWGAAGIMALGWSLAGNPQRISVAWFWAVAILARVALLPMAPGDDVWRYLWEGEIQIAGFSPYLLAPSAPELDALRTPTWSLINHPEATAIYPPIAQLLLRGVAWVGGGVLGLKLVFLLADLAVAGLLARRFGRGAAVFYAWNPLILYIGVGGAHYEPLLVLAMVAGWLAWDRPAAPQCHHNGDTIAARRVGNHNGYLGAWWLGVAAGLKWVSAPLLAWGIWDQLKRGQWRRVVGMGVFGVLPVGLALAWFWVDFGAIGPLAPQTFVREARTSELFPWLLTQVWPESAYRNGILIGFFAPVAAWIFFRAKTMVGFAEAFLVALLVFAPSVHVWYFAWLMPWAVSSRNLGIRAVSVSGFVYFGLWESQAQGHGWEQSPLEKLLLWGPLLLGYWWSRRGAISS
jgi:glycosyltransferase involved in cell wall biosynthesis